MLGYEVNKNVLDHKTADAVLSVRAALGKVETIAKWLANHPNPGTDPLVSEFGYTADEAYVIRLYFETFEAIRNNNASMLDIGRKMTGLD